MRKSKRLIVTSLISLLIFILIFVSIQLNLPLLKLDSTINSLMQPIETNFLVSFSEYLGIIFSTSVLLVAIVLLSIYHWFKKERKDSIFSLLTILLGVSSVFIIKNLVHRARPINMLVNEIDFSFPSGHSTLSLLFFGMIIYFVLKKSSSRKVKLTTTLFLTLTIIVIAFSRLLLNVHWFTDVLGGFSLGLFILTFCIYFRKALEEI